MKIFGDYIQENGQDIADAADIVRRSVFYNKDTVYGAFSGKFDESVMVFEGVPKVFIELNYFINEFVLIKT